MFAVEGMSFIRHKRILISHFGDSNFRHEPVNTRHYYYDMNMDTVHEHVAHFSAMKYVLSMRTVLFNQSSSKTCSFVCCPSCVDRKLYCVILVFLRAWHLEQHTAWIRLMLSNLMYSFTVEMLKRKSNFNTFWSKLI